MELSVTETEDLKAILKNIRNPGLLDQHPWTKSLIVQERLAQDPRSRQARPGQQLLHAIAGLFQDMQPPTPPRRGKRLDPRWGEFGLLAALYFTPFRHGTPFPTSLVDAWRRIDSAILYQVYGKPAAFLTQEQIQRYQLVGGEVDFGSPSTLSDWHRKGVQRLAEILANREQFLSQDSQPASSDQEDGEYAGERSRTGRRTWLLAGLSVLILGAFLLLAGWKGRQIYVDGRAVVRDVALLQEKLPTVLDLQADAGLHPALLTLQSDLASLEKEAGPFLWLGPELRRVPYVGKDLAAAPDALEMAVHLVNAADLSYQASQPLFQQLGDQGSELSPASLTDLLMKAQPVLQEARQELDQSMVARQKINASLLSPRLQGLLVEKVDPLLAGADKSMMLATTLPTVLGASAEGPKTYLLLIQNEDELRATGGFITTVGRLVLDRGQVISLEFEQVDNQEDWSKPYPAAPWQMREFMNIPVMLLRDANWSPDFPTSAGMAERLYAYNHSMSVDGVIAIDQHFLVMLLQELGLLEVEGTAEPITADNVIAYMRAAKRPPEGQTIPAGWYRKEFIPRITSAILSRLLSGGTHDWRGMAAMLEQAVEERHLLVQFDNPQVTSLLAAQGWTNALQPSDSDFLLVTDTNMGYNKTDAVVERHLSYAVDLQDLEKPQALLTVSHSNHADPNIPCLQWNDGRLTEEGSYPVDRCYWSYLRVYRPAATQLLDANPMTVPGEWMALHREIPARVDKINEGLPGIAEFGTFLVVPGGGSLDTHFLFALPKDILLRSGEPGELTYRLKVRKQAGTQAVPLDIKITLPVGAEVLSMPAGTSIKGQSLLLSTNLQKDFDCQVIFRIP